MRNDGPDAVSVAQAVVNDAFVQFTGAESPIGRLETATVRIAQPWVEGEAYEVALVTSAGGTIAHEIPVAVETPAADAGFFGLMALLGIYVGVIPVALGMLWLPWLRRVPPAWLRGLMALDDRPARVLGRRRRASRGSSWRREGSQAFGGAALVFVGAGVAYLLLSGVSAWLSRRAAQASGSSLALLIAIGIGLHNLGEGVAIGAAYSAGALALGAFLVIGFAIHNTTEGIAIVAPIANERTSLRRLATLGLLAGAPGRARGVDRRGRLQRLDRRVPVRLRRRRDRAGHHPAAAVGARRPRTRPAPRRGDRDARRDRGHVPHGVAGRRLT